MVPSSKGHDNPNARRNRGDGGERENWGNDSVTISEPEHPLIAPENPTFTAPLSLMTMEGETEFKADFPGLFSRIPVVVLGEESHNSNPGGLGRESESLSVSA